MMRATDLHGLRLGAYVRISTDTQDGGSRNQRGEIERFVQKHKLAVKEWYCDDVGYSPRGTRNPEFQRMMKDADVGRFDGIIVTYAQRLGFTGPEIVTHLLERIHTLDIPSWDIWEQRDLRECYSDGDLWLKVVHGTVQSAKEVDGLSRKMLEHHLDYGERSWKAGSVAPYGMDSCYYDKDNRMPLYRVVSYGKGRRVQIMPEGNQREYNGRPVPKDANSIAIIEPSIVAERVETIRLMFEWCDREGLTPYQIAQRLNAMGRRTSEGLGWYEAIVRYYLTNPCYIGRPARCRKSYAKRSAFDANGEVVPINNQKRRRRESGIAPVSPAEPVCAPIIDLEQWERVQKRLSPKRKYYGNRSPDAWASGLLKCDRCGGSMGYCCDRRNGRTKKASWRCRNASNGRSGCGGYVSDETVRAVVDKWTEHTKQSLRSGEEINALEILVNEHRARFEAMDFGEPDPAKLGDLDTGIKQLTAEFEQLAERAATIPILKESDVYTRLLNEKKSAIADLECDRREMQERPTREQLVAKIEAAERALAEGEQREYNTFLKAVIQRIGCLNERVANRGRRKYELQLVTIIPVNPITNKTDLVETLVAIEEETELERDGAKVGYVDPSDLPKYLAAIADQRRAV